METAIANGARGETMHDHSYAMITKPSVSEQLPL